MNRFVGCDLTPWAHTIADARVRWARGFGPSIEDLPREGAAQGSLF